jgi:hypothetical protein
MARASGEALMRETAALNWMVEDEGLRSSWYNRYDIVSWSGSSAKSH